MNDPLPPGTPGASPSPEFAPDAAALVSLLDLASDWYWEQDAELRFTRIVGTGGQRSHYISGSAIGQRRWDVPAVHPDPAGWEAHKALLARREPFREFETCRVLPDGSLWWVSISGQPVFDAQGHFAGYRGITRDITARKQAERERARWQTTLENLVDASSDGILVEDASGAVTHANEVFLELFHVTREQILGMPGREGFERFGRMRHADPDGAANWVRGIYADPLARGDRLDPMRDGRTLRIETRPILRGDQPAGRLWNIRNVTPEAHARASHDTMLTLLETVVESLDAGILVEDSAGIVVHHNAKLLHMHGIAGPGFIGQPSTEAFARTAAPLILNWDEVAPEVARIQSDRRHEGRYRVRATGERAFEVTSVPHRAGGAVVGRIWIVRETTEAQRAEDALRRSEEILNEAQSLARAGSNAWSASTGQMSYSPEFCRIIGLPVDAEPVGLERYLERVHPDDRDAMTQRIRAVMTRGGESEAEYRFQRFADDRWIWLHARLMVRLDANGGMLERIGSVQDITQRKALEQQLKDLNERLEERVQARTRELQSAMAQLLQSEKLASLGRLTAGFAHELNTPLGNALAVATTLQTHVQSLENEFARDQLTRSGLQAFLARVETGTRIVEHALARSSELVRSLKSVSADQASTRRREFLLPALFDDLRIALAPMLEHAAAGVEFTAPEGLSMDSLPGPIEQVLTNLIENSLVHGFPDGRRGAVRVSAEAIPGAHVRLRCEDDGAGIAPEHLAKVFDPFFTTRLGQGGSGLGLYVAWTLVTGVLGGRIEVASTPGTGTVFTIELPRTAPASGATSR